MVIRKYQPKDFENMRKICFETSSGFDSDRGKQALYAMYCDYYVLEEPDTCFVAANDNDEAIGYVICAPDQERYNKIFHQKYDPIVKKASFSRWLMHRLGNMMSKKVSKLYPAHLHIDILPEGQRQGLGHRLVDALILDLKQKGVKGVYLVCGAGNEKGVNFYRKYGFKEFSNAFGSVTFVMDID